MQPNSTESVSLAPRRTRDPNPLPAVGSRWFASARNGGSVVIVDRVVFDENRREERIRYREEASGYTGETWRSRFRQRRLFTPVGAAIPAPQLTLPLPAAPPASAPAQEQGPPCSECGAPCQRWTDGKTWRSTCSPKCLAKYRSGLMAKASAVLATTRIDVSPKARPPCVECGSPCSKQANGTWRKTCSAPCLAKATTRGLMRSSPVPAPGVSLAPSVAVDAADEEDTGAERARSLQASIRMSPGTKEAIERIAAELSTEGPFPRPWSVAEVLGIAVKRFVADYDAGRHK